METIDCTLTPGRVEIPSLGIVVTSRVAFYDACRQLTALGYGEAALQAHNERGRPTLRAGKIADAAKITLSETDFGIKRIRWEPFARSDVWPPARSKPSKGIAGPES